jgi:hypothetical protein
MDERRKEKRVAINWPIRLSANNGIVNGLVKNVSLEGLLVLCEDPIPLNENLPVTISPTNCKAISVIGKPIWSNAYGLDLNKESAAVCIGISFIELAMKERHILKAIIEM